MKQQVGCLAGIAIFHFILLLESIPQMRKMKRLTGFIKSKQAPQLLFIINN
jgi:hypothetical protein